MNNRLLQTYCKAVSMHYRMGVASWKELHDASVVQAFCVPGLTLDQLG